MALLDDSDIELAQEVAARVAVAVGNAEAAARTSDDLLQLRTVMLSRALIEQAKGILMARHSITADRAFEMLRDHSQNNGRKLVDIAQAIVDSHLLLLPPPQQPEPPALQ